ncbi:MAG TPA: DMT family transporter [Candidatus Wallbacteria bacterium]|nr:MAG: EamA-like transporter family protein [bacterium ADurb.Bin243]HPG57326.1 DMT family transporter [Candidatus Wallbacteria bacterium]
MSNSVERASAEKESRESGQFLTGILCAVAGVLCFAPGALFIRMAGGIDPLEITLHRMAIASIAIFVFSLFYKSDTGAKNLKECLELGSFGMIAAVHFGCFVASLSFTFVSHSLALCYTAPIFAALFSRVILSERCTVKQMWAIAVTFGGIFILVGFEPLISPKVLFGDFLALISGVALGLYHTVSRMYRDKYTLLKYKANAYFFAAVYLFIVLMVLRFSFYGGFGSVYSAYSVAGVAASAILCTLAGHALINFALRRVSTVLVSLITTQEVTGGIIFAMIFLNETLSAASFAGIAVSLAGITLVILGAEKK